MSGAGGDEIEAYLARPLGDHRRGGVVVIHHMPGYDRATKEMTRRLAVMGYDALCPNLFWREAPGADPDDASAVARASGGVPDERLVGDVAAAADHLRHLPEATGRIGVIGHCSGGRQAVLTACQVQVDAVVDCYGAYVTGDPPPDWPLRVTNLVTNPAEPVGADPRPVRQRGPDPFAAARRRIRGDPAVQRQAVRVLPLLQRGSRLLRGRPNQLSGKRRGRRLGADCLLLRPPHRPGGLSQVMCTYLTEHIAVTGSGKGREGWFRLTDVTVYYDHPVHALDEHTLNIDFAAPALGRGCACRSRARCRFGCAAHRSGAPRSRVAS